MCDYAVIIVGVWKNHSSNGKTLGKYGSKLKTTILDMYFAITRVRKVHVFTYTRINIDPIPQRL